LPISAASIRFQDYQFQHVITTGSWRWTTRMDVTGSIPVFSIRDIFSPYGILRDSIPLPGEVVQAMNSSIDEITANFPANIFMGPPSSLTFEVDEGRGWSDAQNVVITNDGVFGSLLGVTLSTSASHVVTSPANVGNLAANESGAFDVTVDSANLLNLNSPYNETISVQDPNATNNPQTFDVSIIVRPKAIVAIAPVQLGFTVIAPLVGPFPPIPSQQFTLENTGPAGSVLEYQIQRLTGLSDDWLSSFSPVSGTLTSGGQQIVNVATAPIEGMARGTYQETLRISGYSDNSYVDLLVQLVIT